MKGEDYGIMLHRQLVWLAFGVGAMMTLSILTFLIVLKVIP